MTRADCGETFTDSLETVDIGCDVRVFLSDGRVVEGKLTNFTLSGIRVRTFRGREPVFVHVEEIDRMEIVHLRPGGKEMLFVAGFVLLALILLYADAFHGPAAGPLR
ncbi:MAG: hypothetical protein ABIH26_15005 [Candidatus Eisenbacteria bacterium]